MNFFSYLQLIIATIAFLLVSIEIIAWTIMDRIHGFGWLLALALLANIGYLVYNSYCELREDKQR